ncbi:hypothetical protein [uncultured Cellulomonas sp.]|uniref:hypothetical protein n=1 Tax=uncultured Cellulomonas sp. TaxID=189682 RepID=UPI00262F1734|nr:hypothetical protein [uncultured Cellulomonas sp.]
MRWEALFADLEAQLAAAEAAEVTAQVAEVTRAERATVTLGGRLRAARGGAVTVRLRGGELVTGTVLDVAGQWVLTGDGPRRALVPLAAVDAVRGLAPASHPDEGVVSRRLGLGHALRALARDRAAVRISTDGGQVTGRIDGVGADHLDLTVADDPSQARTRGAVWSVPFVAVRVVRSG